MDTDDPLHDQLEAMRGLVLSQKERFVRRGLDVPEFERVCGLLIGAIENGSDLEEPVEGLLPIIEAAGKMIPDVLKEIEVDQPEMSALAHALYDIDKDLEAIEEKGLAEAADVLALRAHFDAALKNMERGETPWEHLDDLMLTVNAAEGEADRQITYRAAALLRWWESRPQDWWDARTPEERTKLGDLLVEWRNGQREELLGKLPLDDRKRIESMSEEDWDKPGAFEP